MPGLELVKMTNDADANSIPGPNILVGSSIEWTYVVTNTGNVTLTEVLVKDDNGTPTNISDDFTACSIARLAANTHSNCVIAGIAAAGQYTNIATASAAPPVGPTIIDADPSSYFGVNPGIALRKKTNGQIAENPPGLYLVSGSSVTWSYEVSNTGNVPLSNVVVEDDSGTPQNPADDVVVCSFSTLSAGLSQTCYRSGTANVGQYGNLGRARGSPPIGADVKASSPGYYFGSSPFLRLEKLTNGIEADIPPGPIVLIGDTVEWKYQVFNEGNVTLENVTISDDNGTPGNSSDDFTVCVIPSLAAGASNTCERNGLATAGQYVNTGYSSGLPPVGGLVSDHDQSHYYGARSGLSLIKKTNNQDANSPPGPYIRVGNPVSWTYDLINTGEVDLTGIAITDDNGTPANSSDDYSCALGVLKAATTRSCVRSGIASQGQYSNLARAVGSYGATQIFASDSSHYFGANPVLQLEKKINQIDADSPPGPFILVGEVLTWTYQITNSGNVNFSNVNITDDNGTAGNLLDDLNICTISSFPIGATQTCYLQGVAQNGAFVNRGKVTGTPPGGLSTVSSTDLSYYFGAKPDLLLVKETNGVDANNAPGPFIQEGGVVTWTYTMMNSGNIDLNNLVIWDDNGTPDNSNDDHNVCTTDTLEIGESFSCSMTGTAKIGQYSNMGHASGVPPGGLASVAVTDVSYYFGARPQIGLINRTQGLDANAAPGPSILAGQPVNWEYEVSNTGNVLLSNIQISDDNGSPSNPGDDFNVCTIPSLAIGTFSTCAKLGLAAAGQHTNIGTAIGVPPGDLGSVRDTDPGNYFGVYPSVQLIKRTNGQDANSPPGPTVLVGNPVEWTYNVINNGNVSLTNLIVKDDNGTQADPTDDLVICTLTNLAAGAVQTCNRQGIASSGQYANAGFLSAVPPLGPILATSDISHYYGAPPGIELFKYTNGILASDPPGPYLQGNDPITWTYQAINTGEVTLFNLRVKDDYGTPTNLLDDRLVCEFSSLIPMETHECSMHGAAKIGQYKNTAVASGTPLGGAAITATATSHYFGILPAVDLETHLNNADADLPPGSYIPVGNAISWSYIITNTGNVVLQNIAVKDDHGTPLDFEDDISVCSISSLQPAASQTCIRNDTAAIGQYSSLATATGQTPVGPFVQDNDAGYYYGAIVLLKLEKRVNGLDSDTPPGPYLPLNSSVLWTYEVKNEGNVDLTSLTVQDDNGTPLDQSDDPIVCSIPILRINETQTCNRSGTALLGQYKNIARAAAIPPGGLTPTSVSDPAHYFGATPQLDLQKLTNQQDADTAPGPYIHTGDPVQWTYTVINNGNVPLSNIIIRDDNGTPSNAGDDWQVCTVTTLGAGQSKSCTSSTSAISGQYENSGSVSATPPGGLPTVIDTDPSHYFGANPSIRLEKLINGIDANSPPGPIILQGDPIQWTFIVSNTGNIALTGIQVKDDRLEQVICPDTNLAVGSQMSCTADGIAGIGDYQKSGHCNGFSTWRSSTSNQFGSQPLLWCRSEVLILCLGLMARMRIIQRAHISSLERFIPKLMRSGTTVILHLET